MLLLYHFLSLSSMHKYGVRKGKRYKSIPPVAFNLKHSSFPHGYQNGLLLFYLLSPTHIELAYESKYGVCLPWCVYLVSSPASLSARAEMSSAGSELVTFLLAS